MFLTKENILAQRNDLSKSMISFHIENKWQICKVDRELLFDEEGNVIDNITPEEIQAGTHAIKEYCLANKNENLYFEYLLAISQEDEKLNVLKEKKKYEIQTKRDEALESGLIYNEHTFQTRKEDKQNINGAATNLMFDMQSKANSISEIIWIDINDEKVTFTPQDFLKFASSVAYHTQEIIFKANALKERIEQAESEQDLEAITWEE
ncbi:DUF4376 domain-containing protein [Campylobacter lari]|uniref:DUF4376 domain-containing protein n=1 Tax=Campylobacter lari TaxID=201 RepID=A0A698G117_CAMLA|nr:DUF4376 domain-containing protein [Campylobacter lari]